MELKVLKPLSRKVEEPSAEKDIDPLYPWSSFARQQVRRTPCLHLEMAYSFHSQIDMSSNLINDVNSDSFLLHQQQHQEGGKFQKRYDQCVES